MAKERLEMKTPIQVVQAESNKWRMRNFPKHTLDQQLLGAMEELGELCHAKLKADQAIRKYALNIDRASADEVDAIGDIVIYMMGFCSARGYDFEECVTKTWEQVKLRDWQKNREDGSTAGKTNTTTMDSEGNVELHGGDVSVFGGES